MTTNRDELLARMAEALRETLCYVDDPERFSAELRAYDDLLAEYDALPQRPEGAAVASRPLGKPSDYTFSGESQTLEELRAELESQPAQAVIVDRDKSLTVSDFLNALGNFRVWQERHYLVNDCGAELALVLRSGYGGYVFRGEKFETLDEAKLVAEKYLAEQKR